MQVEEGRTTVYCSYCGNRISVQDPDNEDNITYMVDSDQGDEPRNTYTRDYNQQKEVREAVAAGQRALYSLQKARRQLDSAADWGIVDILGGVGLVKQMKLRQASECVRNAKRDIERFRDELGDVRAVENLDIDLDDFTVFMDFAFDGLIADIYVQNKIDRARSSVDQAIRQVQEILQELKEFQ